MIPDGLENQQILSVSNSILSRSKLRSIDSEWNNEGDTGKGAGTAPLVGTYNVMSWM